MKQSLYSSKYVMCFHHGILGLNILCDFFGVFGMEISPLDGG